MKKHNDRNKKHSESAKSAKEAKATKKLAKIEKEKVGKDEWKDALARMMMSTGASIHGERSIPHEDAE